MCISLHVLGLFFYQTLGGFLNCVQCAGSLRGCMPPVPIASRPRVYSHAHGDKNVHHLLKCLSSFLYNFYISTLNILQEFLPKHCYLFDTKTSFKKTLYSFLGLRKGWTVPTNYMCRSFSRTSSMACYMIINPVLFNINQQLLITVSILGGCSWNRSR